MTQQELFAGFQADQKLCEPFNLSLQFTQQIKKKVSVEERRRVLTIAEYLCNYSDKDLKTLQKKIKDKDRHEA